LIGPGSKLAGNFNLTTPNVGHRPGGWNRKVNAWACLEPFWQRWNQNVNLVLNYCLYEKPLLVVNCAFICEQILKNNGQREGSRSLQRWPRLPHGYPSRGNSLVGRGDPFYLGSHSTGCRIASRLTM